MLNFESEHSSLAVSSLKNNMVEINRDLWIIDAEACEKGGSVHTAQAIMYVLLFRDDIMCVTIFKLLPSVLTSTARR